MTEEHRTGLDGVVTALVAGGHLRAFAAVTTGAVEEARRLHDLFPTPTAALGRALTAAAMLGRTLKEGQRVQIQLTGNGPLRQVFAEGDASGNVRGYVGDPHVHLPLNRQGKLDVAGAIGLGRLDVIKDLGLRDPYRGVVPLVSGEIAEDLAHYLLQSEQIPSAVALGVRVATDRSVSGAGGLMIQAMPGTPDDLLRDLETRLSRLQNISRMVEAGMTPVGILEAVVGDFGMEVLAEVPVRYACGCNRERFARGLVALGEDELRDIIEEDGQAELVCSFCNATYSFTRSELEELLASALARDEEPSSNGADWQS